MTIPSGWSSVPFLQTALFIPWHGAAVWSRWNIWRKRISQALQIISEDGEMLALVNSTLKKMEQLTDQEFSRLDLETYAQEPAEEV